MSAPPLDNPPTMPTMVSRLPKFGSRPKLDSPSNGAQIGPPPTANSFTSTRLTNGFYHHPGPAGVNGGLTAPPASLKQNGFLRVPSSFSMKWRKENETLENGEHEGRRGKGGNVGQNRSVNNVHQYYSQRQQTSPVSSQSDVKKLTTTSAGKGRGSVHPVTASPPAQVSKTGPAGSKPSRAALGQMNGTKQTQYSFNGSKPRKGAQNGALRQPLTFTRPAATRSASGLGSRSGSPLQKKTPANRSHSSDSLGSAPPVQLTESDRLRSRSLTQFRRQPSPNLTLSSTSSSSSLSHSSAKSPLTNQAPSAGGARGGGVKGKGSAVNAGVRMPSLLPPSALKKPLLLSHGPASKPSGISYKLSRPSLIKQSRPLRVTAANEQRDDQELSQSQIQSPSTSEPSPESAPEAPETKGFSSELVSQGEVSIVGETLEDMSLSSSSSLDRNDTSQEYMDDFDNLGNGGVGILLLSSKNDEDDSGLDQSCARFDDDKSAVNGVAKSTGLCFLDDGEDWTGMRLNGERGEHRLTRLSHRRRTSQPDYHEQGGSSLDLSPSDSCGSGGTYMWDEEGLEPLGGAVTTASINSNSNTTHHIGSFDSDLNSIDILNNLESCDLDDDDLMLDADVPEDGSLHSDGDGISHMAQWRRRQLCWGTQDVHNDTETDFQCYKLTEDPGNKRMDLTRDGDLILELCPPRSPSLSPGSPGFGLDVEELAEDCSAVRSQLEYLQRLLLQEEDADDDTLTTETLSPENDSSHSSDTQVQTLLQEVQQLREELRSRDRTIAQLTKQLTVPKSTTRCHCQETSGRMDRHTQTSVTERESVASQTPWREQTPQILHSSSQDDQKPLTDRCLAPTPPQAPPPANSNSTHPSTTSTAAKEGRDDEKMATKEEKSDTKERKGTFNRSLQLPQPSKLRLFSHASGSGSAASPPSKTKAVRQLSNDSESNGTAGVKVKTSALNLSRLPKPKSH
ncbi:serine-rich coiled-coil domain-containing protein 2-like isoform X2 [Cheilinus undulatus]|uniref:serine-rich coiled-coil domain-containing protein 2-like isoform X2 n=1 Tax=Cheilinus undulatus TaxID=241271 RepID=UPI001BD3CFB3|nr:serine-rich coiled-coil domain-containing protein 2-like isoform X2 [Cheilinus undulatus]